MPLSLSHFSVIAIIVFCLPCFSGDAFGETDFSLAEHSVPAIMVYQI